MKEVKAITPTFMRLDAHNDWQQAATSQTVFADVAVGGLRLGSADQRPIPFADTSGSFGGLTQPTGLTIGTDNRLFLADPASHQILTYTTHLEGFVPLWPAPETAVAPDPICQPYDEAEIPPSLPSSPYHLHTPRGVAVSPDGTQLVVADSKNGRLLVYAWPSLVATHILPLPGGEPWDIAFDSASQLYVADSKAGRVRRFSRLWHEDTAYLGGQETLQRPRHLAIDANDQLFVIDEGLRQVVALAAAGSVLTDFAATQLVNHPFPLPITLKDSQLWLPQNDQPNCPPLPLTGLEVDRIGRIPETAAILLARPAGVRYPRQGIFLSEALDSQLFDCQWHRLVLDLELPDTTNITIRTLTHASQLDNQRVQNLPLNRWSTPITLTAANRPELLIQSQPGQYLWLRLELGGNGNETPLIRAITLYAPRQSSRHFLPPVYHENPVSADFLDRFLGYFDTIFAEIESQIEQFSDFLDPDGVPVGDFLTWLGSWFDLEFLAQWPDTTRRTLIRRAIALYKKRGTVAGMQEILRLHTGLQPPLPVIIEHFRLRNYRDRYETADPCLINDQLYIAGQPLTPTADRLAHHFTIVLPTQVVPNSDALDTLNTLITAQKPAHTAFQLRVVTPTVRLGCQSTVGVDALIGSIKAGPLGSLTLGSSSILHSPDYGTPKVGRVVL